MLVKLVVVGSNSEAKRNLLTNFKQQKIETEYVPTAIENFSFEKDIKGESYNVQIWDTSGSEQFPRLRQLGYAQTNVFLLAYSNTDVNSFESISSYYKELKAACPRAAVILAAVDLNERDNTEWVSPEDGRRKAKKLGIDFIECQVNDLKEVNNLFAVAIEQGAAATVAIEQSAKAKAERKFFWNQQTPIQSDGHHYIRQRRTI